MQVCICFRDRVDALKLRRSPILRGYIMMVCSILSKPLSKIVGGEVDGVGYRLIR